MFRYSSLLIFVLQMCSVLVAKCNICSFFDQSSPSSLTNRVVIFVDTDEQFFENGSISPYHDRGSTNLIRQFYECYGERGGLQVFRVSLSSKYFKKCHVLRMEHTSLPIDPLISNSLQFEVIVSYNAWYDCHTKHPIIRGIRKTLNIQIPADNISLLATCRSHDCNSMKEMTQIWPIRNIFLPLDDSFYEKMEYLVENGVQDFNETLRPARKYAYLKKNRTSHRRNLWPSLASVFIVVLFFILGLFSCIHSLCMCALIDEDFLRRNDERNYLLELENRHQQMEPNVVFLPNNVEEVAQNALSAENLTLRSAPSIDSTQPSESDPLLPETRHT